ncbi:MAG: methylated-DNA--[protein]-cysteine S-methyltransferase [Polyangiaceae bacterium]|nr:methylated-DNA--[protein]-cysteine S-methyltransferase [Polyangiaceae bacterium]
MRIKGAEELRSVNAGRYLVTYSNAGIVRVTLRTVKGDTAKDPANPSLPKFVRDAINDLERYHRGERIDFRRLVLDRSLLTSFQASVLRELSKVPYGKTTDYGSLAKRVGKPGASRAVGTAVGKNPWMVIVPCHRVLRKDGSIGGFSAPGGLVTKRNLLSIEGITVK